VLALIGSGETGRPMMDSDLIGHAASAWWNRMSRPIRALVLVLLALTKPKGLLVAAFLALLGGGGGI